MCQPTGIFECICTHSEVKVLGQRLGVEKSSKEATFLQEKHQGKTDILQEVRIGQQKVFSLMKPPSDCVGHLENRLPGEEKVSPVSCQQ